MTTILVVGGVISLGFNLTLGLFVYWQNPARAVNKYFALFSVSMAVWSAGSFLANAGFDSNTSLRILRFCYAPATFLPAFYFHFICHVTNQYPAHKNGVRIAYCLAAVLAALLPTSFFIQSIRQINHVFWISQPGPVYYIFFSFLIFFTLYGLCILWQTIQTSRGSQKTRFTWMFAAQIIAQMAGFEYFSAVFGWWEHAPLDDYILVGHFTLMAYAILRHHLLDIEVIVRKATIFAGLFAFGIGVISIVSTFGKPFFQQAFGWGDTMSMVPSMVVILIAFRPLESWLTKVTNKYLFQKKTDSTQLWMTFIRDIRGEFDETKITDISERMIASTVEPDRILFYLLDQKLDVYVSNGKEKDRNLSGESAIIKAAKKFKKPVYIHDQNVGKDFLFEMREMKSELVLPLIAPKDNEFLGFILMSKKRSDKNYMKDEIEIYDSLAAAIASSITTARNAIKHADALSRVRLSYIASGMSHQFKNKFARIQTKLDINVIFPLQQAIEEIKTAGTQNQPADKYKMLLEELLKVTEQQVNTCIEGKNVANTITAMGDPNRKKSFAWDDISAIPSIALEVAEMEHDKDPDFKEITLTYEKPMGVPQLYCSRVALVDTISNAITNSFESIKLKTNQPISEGKICLSLDFLKESNTMRIIIQDNGLGIKEEHKSAVGTPSFTTKGVSGGTTKSGYGIGVHVMKEFVAMHGGTLYFESEEGKGADCIINLPYKPKENQNQGDK